MVTEDTPPERALAFLAAQKSPFCCLRCMLQRSHTVLYFVSDHGFRLPHALKGTEHILKLSKK